MRILKAHHAFPPSTEAPLLSSMSCSRLIPLSRRITLISGLCCMAVFGVSAASAQTAPRYGLGFNVLATTSDGIGLGIHGRAAIPVNSNLSIGGDVGVTGFIFGGRDDASYAFDPQVSLIITLPGTDRATYVMGGVGAYIPTSDSEGGPTLHFGIGRAQLIGETSVYYELDPAIVIEKSEIQFNLPLRFGIIF